MPNGMEFLNQPIGAKPQEPQPGLDFLNQPISTMQGPPVSLDMDSWTKAALAITSEMSWIDKLIVGAGQRSTQILTSLPIIGEGLAEVLGVHDEVRSLPGLGAAGFVGSLIPDLLLFRGLGGVGRAAATKAAGAGVGQFGQLVAREAGIGAAYGALTHRDRLKGAAVDALLFGTFGAALGGMGRVPKELRQRVRELRSFGGWFDRTSKHLLERTPPETRVEAIRAARREGTLKRAFELTEEPIPGDIAGAASRDITQELSQELAPAAVRARIYRLKGRLKKLGFEDEAIFDTYEAATGVRDVKDMVLGGASELSLELSSMARVSRMLRRGKRPGEAIDPVFVQQMSTDLLNDGLNVGMFDAFLMPALEEASIIESRTGVPIYRWMKEVAQAKNLQLAAEIELPKRIALMAGFVEPKTAETITSRELRRIAGRMRRSVSGVPKDRREVIAAHLNAPDLHNRVYEAGIEALGEEAAGLSGRTLTLRALAAGEKSLSTADRRLWQHVKGFTMSKKELDLVLSPEELRWSTALKDLMEDWRVRINRAQIPAVMRTDFERNGVIYLPPKVGFMPKFRDLNSAMIGSSRVSRRLGIGEFGSLRARTNEAERYLLDPFEAAKLYNRRAIKLLTLEVPVRQALGFAGALRNVERNLDVTRGPMGKYASEFMEYWLGRVWGVPTATDMYVANNVSKMFDMLGVKVPEANALAVASLIRDVYYIGLIGLRIPFVAGRNITQAPLLAGTELGGGFSWIARGYGRGFKELGTGRARDIMRKYGAWVKYAEGLDLVVDDAAGALPRIAEHVARLRNTSMYVFMGSDRLNRLASFWGAVEKFEYYLGKLPTAKLKEGQSSIDWLIHKVGIGKLRPAEQAEFRRLLSRAAQKERLVSAKGEKGIVEARKAYEEAKYRFGASVSNRTQFAYSTVGSPLVTRSVAGKLTFQFLTWPLYYGSFLRTMAKSPEGKLSLAAHMAMSAFAAAQFLKVIEYDPQTSMLLGPFASAFTRTEYGAFTPSPGPAVGSAVNLFGSMITDANNILHGDFERIETPRTIGRAISGAFPILGRDWRRLERVWEGRPKTMRR